MAPVLLCPECGTKHPLGEIGARSAFPCTGCGRTLKVPAGATAATAPRNWPPAPATVSPDVDPHATQMLPTAGAPMPDPSAPLPVTPPVTPPVGAPIPAPPIPEPLPSMPFAAAPAPSLPPPAAPISRTANLVPPRTVRFALWIVAVPLAFLVVFGLARVFGVLSTNDITDVALADGWHRFMPIVRLLPLVALVTAALVQGGVFGIARFRARGAGGKSPSRPSGPSGPDSNGRTSTGSRSTRTTSRGRSRSRQSSRTGA